ncbi:MAG: hypothetical protein ACJ788_21590 [Ktedonobacteraceae bacterium]
MQKSVIEKPRRRRPLGITIMSVLLGIQAVVELLLGVLAIFALSRIGHSITVAGYRATGNIVDFIGWALASVPIMLGIITLILALGLWFLKRWAFWTTAIIMLIALIREAIVFVRPHGSIVPIILEAIIPIVILVYLFADPHVRAAFRV